MTTEIDTMNRQAVGVQGDAITVMLPTSRMTPLEAYTHAAWLVTMAEMLAMGSGEGEAIPDFDEVLEAVRSC